MKLDLAMFFGVPLFYLWYDAYEVLEMIFLIAYCMYMLTMHKRLSVWSFLIVGFTTFVLRMLTSYYHAKQNVYGSYGSQDIAIALTEILYCFAKFLLIWGVLFMIRKYMNQWEFFIKRSTLKAVICLFVLTLFFFLNFNFEYKFLDKPYVYQRVCDFWVSVIPEFYWVDKHVGIQKGWIDENDEENVGADVVSGEKVEALKTFRVEDIKAVDLRDEFVIEDYYIKNKVILDNRFFIDEDQVLWGYGRNVYGQLGIGKADELDAVYAEPIKIAENVVSVDCSVNGYFCIYLTADGELYGMGSNMLGLLGQEYTETYTVEEYNKVTTPVLLMENVSYARAGREAIVVLDRAGSVWWWGQYRATYSTENNNNMSLLYWQSTQDESNPIKMLYNHPTKILENCIYATTGDWSGAAIGQNGELYTWGLNIFGECGTEVTGDDYLRMPTKVLDNVRMVWPEKISFGSIEEELPEIGRYDTTYHFNMFVQMQDGTMMAAGENLGDKEKTIAITGDLSYASTHTYSDTFVPIALEEFSEVGTRKKLQQLAWGMSMEEAEEILSQEGIQHFRTAPENGDYIVVEDSRYFLDFDEDGHLNRIRLQEGGSRNLQFEMGMTMEEVRSKINDDFIVEKYDDSAVYWTREPIDDSYLGFSFYDNGLYFVFESAVRPD